MFSVWQKHSQNTNLVTDHENTERSRGMRFSFSHHCKAPRTISAGSTLVATNNGSCIPAVIDRMCETMDTPTHKLSPVTKRIAIIMTMQRRQHAAMAKKCFGCTRTIYRYTQTIIQGDSNFDINQID